MNINKETENAKLGEQKRDRAARSRRAAARYAAVLLIVVLVLLVFSYFASNREVAAYELEEMRTVEFLEDFSDC